MLLVGGLCLQPLLKRNNEKWKISKSGSTHSAISSKAEANWFFTKATTEELDGLVSKDLVNIIRHNLSDTVKINETRLLRMEKGQLLEIIEVAVCCTRFTCMTLS